MSYITKSVTIIITLFLVEAQDYKVKQYTRQILLKQGVLQGVVVEAKHNRDLPLVEQYLGIPYAAAPVGELRFMPSGSAPIWFGVKYADTFGPVCPQKFPDEQLMTPHRREYFKRLQQYLFNQSEDCLYLNIYAPVRGSEKRKYPVMVFIHGESFEWNSGNPYDGSVLASYGKVIVVTLNFRLGILGFLKAGTEEHSKSNFGLVDQIAALLWVKENIEAFGGNPATVTLFGHGTGAVCASLLMLSPIVQQDGNQMLFQRAILMGGTALSDWALAANARDVTYQVAQELNCQIQDDFAACLRQKRLHDIMEATTKTPNYTTRFGPIVDHLVVPNEPRKSMTQYSDIFRRFELMYGVTELESMHLLGPVAALHGMLEKERDEELRNYLRTKCEMRPELCVARTLAEYSSTPGGGYGQEDGVDLGAGHEPDRATLARDALLDILSDARTVAPIVQTARYHSAVNAQSYFYVFTHKTTSKEYIRDKSFNGEELPYVFGVPFDGPRFHFTDQYTKREQLLSEHIMMYFSNFAYSGNPNVARKNEYYSLSPSDWSDFDVNWPEFDGRQQQYIQLDDPPKLLSHYRNKEVTFWNDIFPHLLNNRTYQTTRRPLKNPPPWIWDHIGSGKSTGIYRYTTGGKPSNFKPKQDVYGTIKLQDSKDRPDNIVDKVTFGTIVDAPSASTQQSSTMHILIIIGGLFLLANLILFLLLYYKCYRIKKKNQNSKPSVGLEESVHEKHGRLPEEVYISNGCSLVQMLRKSSKSEDSYEAVKGEDQSGKFKLTRQMSSSTIDAHTKVRDWITNEIIYKYSPRFFRARNPNGAKQARQNEEVTIPIHQEKDSTLGRSPTRPVSPVEDKTLARPLLSKSSSLSSQKQPKPEKVSVAIDATPTGRGPSVLMQQPIELTKSLDYPNYTETEVPLRRSITLEDFSPRAIDVKKEMRKSTTSINLRYPIEESTIVKIEHSHSKSEPVQDMVYSKVKKLKTFDPNNDVNVTCKDDLTHVPLTPEESLMTIKRRNFPKVLPDHPGREALLQKRMSMPVHNHFNPIPEVSSFSNPNSPTKNFAKLPPAPPPRTTSSLARQNSANACLPVCLSEPQLAEEPPKAPEPELACNNLYVGPLIPKNEPKLNTQPAYDKLRVPTVEPEKKEEVPKTIITANPTNKRTDPKIVVRAGNSRKTNDGVTKVIPRVVVPDNQPTLQPPIEPKKIEVKKQDPTPEVRPIRPVKKSQIPTLVKNSNTSLNKESSSSDSPSEASDTGTVVKRI